MFFLQSDILCLFLIYFYWTKLFYYYTLPFSSSRGIEWSCIGSYISSLCLTIDRSTNIIPKKFIHPIRSNYFLLFRTLWTSAGSFVSLYIVLYKRSCCYVHYVKVVIVDILKSLFTSCSLDCGFIGKYIHLWSSIWYHYVRYIYMEFSDVYFRVQSGPICSIADKFSWIIHSVYRTC